MQHQARLAEQRQRAAQRQRDAAIRRAEQARRAEERARLAAQRASEAELKRLEREASEAHVAAMQAEVNQQNAALEAEYDKLDSLLAATLEVDDYVDLERLRRTVQHPPFDPKGLDAPLPQPIPIQDPPEPARMPVEKPTGLFGRKKKLEEATIMAEAAFTEAYRRWQIEIQDLPKKRQAQIDRYQIAEQARKDALVKERAAYDKACAEREKEVLDHNKALDEFIANLGYGTEEAVQQYIGIVLANSVYPENFEVDSEFDFNSETAELTLRVQIPAPGQIPTIKVYRYVKASDEITSTPLSQKASKDRYSEVVQQVALRSLHEVFEADRRGLIQSISLEVGTETADPATGKNTYLPFVAVGASREKFMEVDLKAVVPSATLEYLGASVSKNPFGLVAAKVKGIRSS
jgi:restriction system protein